MTATARRQETDSSLAMIQLITDDLIEAGEYRISDVLADLLDTPVNQEEDEAPSG